MNANDLSKKLSSFAWLSLYAVWILCIESLCNCKSTVTCVNCDVTILWLIAKCSVSFTVPSIFYSSLSLELSIRLKIIKRSVYTIRLFFVVFFWASCVRVYICSGFTRARPRKSATRCSPACTRVPRALCAEYVAIRRSRSCASTTCSPAAPARATSRSGDQRPPHLEAAAPTVRYC